MQSVSAQSYPEIQIEGKTYYLLTKEQLKNKSYKLIGIYYQNYQCDNKEGKNTVKVLTPGIHEQQFTFG